MVQEHTKKVFSIHLSSIIHPSCNGMLVVGATLLSPLSMIYSFQSSSPSRTCKMLKLGKKGTKIEEGTWVLTKTNMEKEKNFFHDMVWSKRGYQLAW
jgi:hypothetical protein